jgi:hypothetical protein
MEDRNLNYAGENAQVGVQGNNVNGPFTVNFGRSHSQVAVDPALQEILGQLEQLRLAIAAAQQRTELARAASVTALQELETVTKDVAAHGDKTRVLASLDRIRKPLAGALDLLAKLAAIMAAVRGL